jgi:hypothetical protein
MAAESRSDTAAAPLTEAAARALVAGHLETLLDRRAEIAKLSSDEVRNLAEIARATRFNCGGNACG